MNFRFDEEKYKKPSWFSGIHYLKVKTSNLKLLNLKTEKKNGERFDGPAERMSIIE